MAGFADTTGLVPARGGPWSFLAWLVLQQRRRIVLGAVLGTAWMVGLVVPPLVLSLAVDGLVAADRPAVLLWSAALVVTGSALGGLGIWRHRTMTQVRMDAAYRTVSVVTAQAVRLGASLKGRGRAGEVVAIGSGDAWTIGRSLTVTGPGVGAVLAYVVIAVLLLQVSVALGLMVLAGVPVLVLILGPALAWLRSSGGVYRDREAVVTGRVVDIVAGLSVLNGVGGKEVYADRFRRSSQQLLRQGYRVGRVTAMVQAIGLGLPTLFMAVVVWLAARLVLQGSITVGDLVAVFGYAGVLVVPISSFIESAVDINRALVAGRRVTDFLSLERDDGCPSSASGRGRSAAIVPADGALVDDVSGLRVSAGAFTAIVTARQVDAIAVVDRLAGLTPGATWGGQPITDLESSTVREHLLVADNDAAVFAGSLAEVVAGRCAVDDSSVRRALHVAAADDVVEALPDGLRSPISSSGSNLSGGQRQRVRLARAVLANPTVLLAVDPTSAVDAATESAMIKRLVQSRSGLTTVVTSTSALLLAEVDEVHLLTGARLIASGTHESLLRDVPAYAAVVYRGDAPAGDGGVNP